MRDSEYEPVARMGICACCIIINFIWPFLVGFSFDTIGPDEVGILYNRNIGRLGENPPKMYGGNPFESGRYFTGLGVEFKTFPSTLQRIEMANVPGSKDGPVDARTRGGLQVSLSISFLYRLKLDPTELLNLYLDFGDEWDKFYRSYARAEVRDVISEYTVADLWNIRAEIGDALEHRMRAKLAPAHADLYSLQVLSLLIPDPVQNAIEDTAIEAQGIQQARFEVAVATVQANTSILEATEEMRSLVLEANGDARTTIISAQADANSTITVTAARSNGHQEIKTSLGMSNPELLDFIWMDTIREMPTRTRTTINLGATAAFKGQV